MTSETVVEKTENQVLLKSEGKKLVRLRLIYYPLPKYSNHSEHVIELEGCRLSVYVLDHGWNTGDNVNISRRLSRNAAEELSKRMLDVSSMEEFSKLFADLIGGNE